MVYRQSVRGLVYSDDDERSLVDSLLGELYSFVGERWEQEDDITLLMLECSATRSKISEKTGLVGSW